MPEVSLPLWRAEVQPIPKGSHSGWRCRRGEASCTRSKPCPACLGARNRRKGLKKQREARKALGIKPNRFGDGNEENWSDALFATEVKAGKQAGPVVTFWRKCEAQIIVNQPDWGNQHKEPRVVVMPDGWPAGEGIVMVRLSSWRTIIVPALEQAS